MPVTLREKRRSLHIGSSGKFSELAKEVAMRPQSWYLASSNIELDPYTSVRKIFYEFPKKAFYGEHDNEAKDEIISNIHTNLTSSAQENCEKNHRNELNNSFINLTSKLPSPATSHKSYITSHKNTKNDSDNNNNISSPSVKTNILNMLTQKNSELKEESSSYADFYVPNATKASHNFLRRNYPRRKNIDKNGLDNDDAISVTSFISASSCKLIANSKSHEFTKFRDVNKLSDKLGSDNVFFSDPEVSPSHSHDSKSGALNSPPSPSNTAEEYSDRNPIMERFLRDANDEDICKGVYPSADDSKLFHESHIISTLKLANKERFVPWSKRLSFVNAKLEENSLQTSAFNDRRNSRLFSSLKFYRNKGETNEKYNRQRRLSQNYESATIRSSRGFTSLRRHHSESGVTSRKNKMSSTLSLYRQETNTYSRSSLNRSLRRKAQKIEAREFFLSYEDKLRNVTFTIDKQSNSDCKTTSSLCGVYDYISRAFEAKLLGNTYQQLFYIRSRLTVKAQKSNFICDGYFGCGGEVSNANLPTL